MDEEEGVGVQGGVDQLAGGEGAGLPVGDLGGGGEGEERKIS